MNAARPIRLLACAALVAACSDAAPAAAPWTVHVDTGDVRATPGADGSVAFLGIPYAAPPVGALRWAPPSPAAAWSSPRDASAFGPSCAQVVDPEESTSTGPQSEDCLSLNVWAPSTGTAATRRPVMVFVHGGGWTNGGTRDPWYDGAALSRRGVVVVSMNYRLGVFGFLDLSDPAVGGAAYAASGSMGLQDQLAAMRWVQRNIAAFGGDPGNVTVFGHSAGAMSVTAMLASPDARGLFHKAIVQSGAGNLLRSPDVARRVTQRVLTAANVTTVDALRALPTSDVLAAERTVLDGILLENLTFAPSIDGTFVREPPLAVIARGDGARVPLLTGTVATEARYWILYNSLFGSLAPSVGLAAFPWIASAVGADRVTSIIAGYQSRRPGVRPGDLTLALATDVFFRVPQIRLAEAHVAGGATAYMYQFTWPTPVAGGALQSPHGVEVPFVFASTTAARDFVGDAPPASLTTTMQDVWVGFARTGAPPGPGGAAWAAYTPATRSTFVLDVASHSADDPAGDDRRAWDGVAFDSRSPAVDPLASAF